MTKIRLDILLFERGLAESRERAKAVIMSGKVFIGGIRAEKPGMKFDPYVDVDVRGGCQYVSRGGQKLEKALSFFGVSPKGKVCIDCGASTGGFTDCLLKNGAKLVYAVDVGYGQLAWSLRSDPRVVAMDRTNVRFMKPDMIEIKPSLAVIDVSFISLGLVLPAARGLLAGDGEAICLIKPQFEAGREKVGKKGVVRDPATHKEVLDTFLVNSEQSGFCAKGLSFSPVKGPEGNIEYLGWLGCSGEWRVFDTEAVVIESHKELGNCGSREGENYTVP
ncbi:MAG: TlyA family RNA methyltransferase [Oscillospiraceae bacterium]|jgi:23S rRNA (cytidine1920-2'-O)/16S rRNA (cytidine1409-2'-O)-methyltransferase|nr:TlyA family RNA methyltransferase [Oscillospiraceae bacterium]